MQERNSKTDSTTRYEMTAVVDWDVDCSVHVVRLGTSTVVLTFKVGGSLL